MTILNISLPKLQMFFLVFLRVGAIMMTVPIFDSRNIPLLFKAGLAFSVSIVAFPLLNLNDVPFITDVIPFGIGVIAEVILGVIIGLSVRMVFSGIQLAGQLAGFQMGLAIANVMDPVTSTQASILAQINNLIAMLIFLSMDAHHWLFRALVESFRMVPPFNIEFGSSVIVQLIGLGGKLFVVAIQVAAPIMAALLLTSVVFGLMARTVPQMNVFIVAMPLKIIVGLLFLALSLPYWVPFLGQLFITMGSDIRFVLSAL